MCDQVTITEDMADGLTPPKPAAATPVADSGIEGEGKDGGESKFGGGGGAGRGGSAAAAALAAEEDRLDTIRSLARACKKQGSFTLACKKFTQAGEREKAMKCLLKSGDTKAVCYYATVSRSTHALLSHD
jgi:intraflagellar transport protein 140